MPRSSKLMLLFSLIFGLNLLPGMLLAKDVCVSPTGCYVNSSGHLVPRPHANARHDRQATALCRDGTESYSEHHSGTCSGHGGVREWYR